MKTLPDKANEAAQYRIHMQLFLDNPAQGPGRGSHDPRLWLPNLYHQCREHFIFHGAETGIEATQLINVIAYRYL